MRERLHKNKFKTTDNPNENSRNFNDKPIRSRKLNKLKVPTYQTKLLDNLLSKYLYFVEVPRLYLNYPRGYTIRVCKQN